MYGLWLDFHNVNRTVAFTAYCMYGLWLAQQLALLNSLRNYTVSQKHTKLRLRE